MELNSDLIRLCLKGKPKAQHQLYQLVYGSLMRVCMRYAQSREEAVDYLNQIFMHLLQQLGKYNEAMPFEPWLKRLAVNFILNLLRADKKYRDLNHAADYENSSLLNTPDEHFDIGDQLNYEQLLSMIRQLPPMSATVFNLYVVDGYKHREIGELLNISENTSKWHLMNARTILQKMILKMEGTPMEAESFDKKIRKLLDSAEFPYQEADWQQAQALLQKERKRKGLWWLWLFPALVGGIAWWMLMNSQAESSPKVAEKYMEYAPAAITDQESELKVELDKSNPIIRAEQANANGQTTLSNESAVLPPALLPPSKNRKAKPIDHYKMSANITSAADEVTAKPDLISYLMARKVLLQRTLFEKPSPSKRPAEPFHFERPKAKSSPTWTLGLYTASQPSWIESGERGTGKFNWQAGTFAAIQLENGFYGQWLVGVQQQSLRNWTYVNNATTYDFGFERTTQTLELRDYWTLQNAWQLGYAYGKHRAYAAITYQRYLFSRYNLMKQTERQDGIPVIEAENGSAPWPQADMQRFLPGLGYQYEISPAFRLGLQYQFRSAQSSNNALPSATPWQISLQYHLFQRQQP